MKKLTLLILAFILILPVFAEEVPETWIPFDEEVSLFIKNDDLSNRYILVNKDGTMADQGQGFRAYEDYSFPNILCVEYNGLYGFVDTSGMWIAEPQFDFTNGFQDNGLAEVKKDGLWGLIDLKGEYVFEPQFESYFYWDQYFIHFFNHAARVKKGGLFGYIRDDGTFLFEPQFEQAGFFEDSYAVIGENGKKGYVSLDGEIAISPQFEGAFDFSGDYALVKQDGLFGYIDREGHIVLEPSYVCASEKIYDGIAAVSVDGETWGYIKMDGEYLFEPQFDRAEPFICGVAAVEIPIDDWAGHQPNTGLVDTEGNFLLEPEYSMISLYKDGSQYRFCDSMFSEWISASWREEDLDPVDYDLIVIAYRDYGYEEVQNFAFIDGVFTEIPVIRVYNFEMEF